MEGRVSCWVFALCFSLLSRLALKSLCEYLQVLVRFRVSAVALENFPAVLHWSMVGPVFCLAAWRLSPHPTPPFLSPVPEFGSLTLTVPGVAPSSSVMLGRQWTLPNWKLQCFHLKCHLGFFDFPLDSSPLGAGPPG